MQPNTNWSGYRNDKGAAVAERPTTSRPGSRTNRRQRPANTDQIYRQKKELEERPASRTSSPTKQISTRPPSSPVKRPQSRGRSATRRDDLTELSRPRSRLDYFGFEEYDGGRLSQVGKQIPAKIDPPKGLVKTFQASTAKRSESMSRSESKPAEDSYFSRPNTYQYKSLKNLSPRGDQQQSSSSYTPSALDRPTTAFQRHVQNHRRQSVDVQEEPRWMRSSKSMHALPIMKQGGETEFKQPQELLIDTTNRSTYR